MFKYVHGRESYKQYYLPTVEIKDYNGMIHGKKLLDHPIKNHLKSYDNIRKNVAGQCDDYTNVCLLNYPYFEKYYKLIAIDLSKQQN